MLKYNAKSVIYSLVVLTLCSHVNAFNLDKHETWFRTIKNTQQKVAKLRFYVQDVLAGPNATVWEVARANITHASPTTFGQVIVMDDVLTSEPDPNSKILGRAQGVLTSTDLQVSALAMNVNYVFTAGKYNGSSVCIVGRNAIMETVRELPIVSGTGVFRMARGFSISRTYSFDQVKSHGVIEHNMFIAYFE